MLQKINVWNLISIELTSDTNKFFILNIPLCFAVNKTYNKLYRQHNHVSNFIKICFDPRGSKHV